jgi:hypothetical protein
MNGAAIGKHYDPPSDELSRARLTTKVEEIIGGDPAFQLGTRIGHLGPGAFARRWSPVKSSQLSSSASAT